MSKQRKPSDNGVIRRSVTLEGVRPIMFDRYAGDNKTQLPPDQKLYLDEDGNIVLPAANVQSFLCAENTKSAVKMLYEPRRYKPVAQAVLGYVTIEPFLIPFTRKGKPIPFEGFNGDGVWLHESVARLDKGIPNPKRRPVLNVPWNLTMTVSLFPNDVVDEASVRALFERCGIPIGLGTYRGVFGKFVVAQWD